MGKSDGFKEGLDFLGQAIAGVIVKTITAIAIAAFTQSAMRIIFQQRHPARIHNNGFWLILQGVDHGMGTIGMCNCRDYSRLCILERMAPARTPDRCWTALVDTLNTETVSPRRNHFLKATSRRHAPLAQWVIKYWRFRLRGRGDRNGVGNG